MRQSSFEETGIARLCSILEKHGTIYVRTTWIRRSGSRQYIRVAIPKTLCNDDTPCTIYVVVARNDRSTTSRESTREAER